MDGNKSGGKDNKAVQQHKGTPKSFPARDLWTRPEGNDGPYSGWGVVIPVRPDREAVRAYSGPR